MRSWAASLGVGLIVFAAALANRSAMVLVDDVAPHMFVPWIALRGYGVDFQPVISKYGDDQAPLQPYLTRVGGRVLSVFPYASGWIAAPVSLPQLLWMDVFQPGWDREGPGLLAGLTVVGKRTSAAIVAVTAVLLHRLLIAWVSGAWSMIAVLVTVLGSNLWMIASQATWQHGPAALCLAASLFLLCPGNGESPGRLRLVLSGAFAAGLVAIRLADVALALGIAVVARRQARSWAFFVFPVLIGTALAFWNLATFGSLAGGQVVPVGRIAEYYRLDVYDPKLRLEGLLGTLVSPNRGLLVSCPWCIVLPFAVFGKGLDVRARMMALASIPFWLVIGLFPVWWAGHSFGPRYWTEAMPLFAAPLAWALQQTWKRSTVLFVLLVAACVWSVAVQVIGAVCYPSTWNQVPANVDFARERLWDWRDTELLRCLSEGPLRR